jgi:hypothetical protein
MAAMWDEYRPMRKNGPIRGFWDKMDSVRETFNDIHHFFDALKKTRIEVI